MGLFPDSWKALASGFPSLLHWNRYTKAVHLMRGQNGVRVFLQNGGAVIEGTEASRGRMAFEAFIDGANTIGVEGGYAQGQTGALEYVSARAGIAVSANMVVYARYDLGSFPNLPQWEVVSGSIIQTAAAWPSFDARYVAFPIALVSWDGAAVAIARVSQQRVGMLPCPDMTKTGRVAAFNVNYGTTIYGWHICDGTNATLDIRKKFISGRGASDVLSSGALTASITAAELNAAQTPHNHNLGTSGLTTVESGTTGIFVPVPDTLDSVTADFTDDIEDIPIIPPNVAATFYQHL